MGFLGNAVGGLLGIGGTPKLDFDMGALAGSGDDAIPKAGGNFLSKVGHSIGNAVDNRINSVGQGVQSVLDSGRDLVGANGRPRRGIGNVLSDFFSAEKMAERRPLSHALGQVGDAISALSGNPIMWHQQQYNANTGRMRQDEEYQRQQGARQAMGNYFQDQSPETLNRIAQYDPQTAFGIRNAEQARQDKLNAPIEVNGNLVQRNAQGGYDTVFQAPEEWRVATGADGTYAVNRRSGQAVRVGGVRQDKPLVIKGGDGQSYILGNGGRGRPVPIGNPKPVAATRGATGAGKMNSAQIKAANDARAALGSLDAMEAQIKRVQDAMEAAEKGGWTGAIYGFVPGALDSESGTFDKEVGLMTALARNLTRTPGEGSMSDYESRLAAMPLPSRRDTPEARRAALEAYKSLVSNKRKYLQGLLQANTSSAPAAQPTGLPKVGEIKGGYRFKGGNPANRASWEKVQ